jgi:hypothetical protein
LHGDIRLDESAAVMLTCVNELIQSGSVQMQQVPIDVACVACGTRTVIAVFAVVHPLTVV